MRINKRKTVIKNIARKANMMRHMLTHNNFLTNIFEDKFPGKRSEKGSKLVNYNKQHGPCRILWCYETANWMKRHWFETVKNKFKPKRIVWNGTYIPSGWELWFLRSLKIRKYFKFLMEMNAFENKHYVWNDYWRPFLPTVVAEGVRY